MFQVILLLFFLEFLLCIWVWKWKAKLTQSRPTLWDPMDYTVHEILQARILEYSVPKKLFPSPGDLPNPGVEPRSPALQVDSLPAEPPGTPCIWYTFCSCPTVLEYCILFPPAPSVFLFFLCFLAWKSVWTFHKCRDSFFRSVQSTNEPIEDTCFCYSVFDLQWFFLRLS